MLIAVVVGVLGGGLARGLQPSAREIELLGQFCGAPLCICLLDVNLNT